MAILIVAVFPSRLSRYTAASSRTDQAAIEQLLAEHGRDGFVPAWLQNRGVAWATDLIPNLSNLERSL